MFDLYNYLKTKQSEASYAKGIYICTGSAMLEELTQNVRDTLFPCIVVEVGDDGWLDMLTSDTSVSVVTFFLLESKTDAAASHIRDILLRTKSEGKKIIRQMRSEASEYGAECFGIDFSHINYFKVGPLALNSYGYCFNLTINEQ